MTNLKLFSNNMEKYIILLLILILDCPGKQMKIEYQSYLMHNNLQKFLINKKIVQCFQYLMDMEENHVVII